MPVIRLVTVVDVEERQDTAGVPDRSGPAPEHVRPGWAPAPPSAPTDTGVASFSAVLLALLDDGRRLLLLDDRGWTEGGPGDVWQHMSAGMVAATARTVVGPDEPFGDQTAQDAEAAYWDGLAGVLGRQGVRAGARELSDLPHDVELSGRLRARLNGR